VSSLRGPECLASRNCIEEALLPLTCEFTLCRDASLTLKVFDADTGRVNLDDLPLNSL